MEILKSPVPTNITKEINTVLSLIKSNKEAVYVSHKPIPNAPINECFILVDEKVKKEGGCCVLGWQIWQGTLLVEAEFHAVWKTSDGEVIDITPKPFPVDQIFFVESPRAKYEGKQVNNIRVNITKNPLQRF